MRVDKKKERATQKLIELLKSQGKLTEESAADIGSGPVFVKDSSFLQAEAVLLSLEKPARFMVKVCKRCGESFGTDYRAVAYCSDHCRAKSLEAIGIKWNPHKDPRERWGSPFSRVEPPLTIPPDLLKQMAQLTQNQNSIQSEPEPEQEFLVDDFESHTSPPVEHHYEDGLQFEVTEDPFVL